MNISPGWGLVLAVVGAFGGVTGLVALIMLFPNILKLRSDRNAVDAQAEHTEIDGASILSKASLDQMTAAIQRSERVEQLLVEAQVELRAARKAITDYHAQAQGHVPWDFMVYQWCRQNGYDPGMPPPLFPPAPPEEGVVVTTPPPSLGPTPPVASPDPGTV